ncbi:Molybdenum cofactor biosynthesis protein B [Candidatus Magnetomoraceae bacterium gMMP-15]
MSTKKHKCDAPKSVNIGIISISSTRFISNDKSGHWIAKIAKKEGHDVKAHLVIPDDVEVISTTIKSLIDNHDIQVLLISGGTGISPGDVTIEAVRPMFKKELTAFRSIFAQLSFEQIDSAAILSRATAGIIDNVVLFCMPGSLKAVKLACKELIFPELGHVIKHIQE